jgi:hypothetical protein
MDEKMHATCIEVTNPAHGWREYVCGPECPGVGGDVAAWELSAQEAMRHYHRLMMYEAQRASREAEEAARLAARVDRQVMWTVGIVVLMMILILMT